MGTTERIRWRRDTIILDCAANIKQPTQAYIAAGLAVHYLSRGWRVTHVASGRHIQPTGLTREQAFTYARKLLALGDWERDGATVVRAMGEAGAATPARVQGAAVMGPRPTEIRATVPYYVAVRDFKAHLIAATLAAHGGNRTRAARALGIQRTYLLRLIRNLRVREFPEGRG